MKHVYKLTPGTLGVLVLGVVLLVLLTGEVRAQTIKDLAGTWTLVSLVNEQDGRKIDSFGPNPRGIMMVDANGRYVSAVLRPELPKFASNNRATGTPEENKAIVLGSLINFGTLAVNAADKTITFKIETSACPNWDRLEQKRVFTLSGDELMYTVPATTAGGTSTVVWKRAK